MSQFPQITIKHAIGNVLDIPNQVISRAFTYFASNTAIGATTLESQNAIDFTAASLLQLSSIGSEKCEIIDSASHTDEDFTVTAIKMNHSRGDIIREIGFDQVEVHKSSTIDGTYSLLSTNDFQMTQMSTIVNDLVGLTSDFYKLRWKNSDTSDLSSFSTPISVLTYPENSVAELIFPVLKAMGVSENDKRINIEFLLSAIDDARKFVKANLYGVRHAWNQDFEYPIKVLAGNNYVDLPSTIDFNETNRSLLAARFLLGNVLTPYSLSYIDKRSWNSASFQIMGSNASVLASIGAVTLDVDNAGDFEAGTNGSIAHVATDSFDQVIMEIAYTGVDLVNNQLTGVTGITRAIPVGARVWSNPTIGQPVYYTVYENKIVFDRVVSDSMQGNNLYIDFYKKLDKATDLYQELPEPYREIYKWYLRWAIKYRKDTDLPASDPDLKKFEELVGALFDNLYTGQDTIIVTN